MEGLLPGGRREGIGGHELLQKTGGCSLGVHHIFEPSKNTKKKKKIKEYKNIYNIVMKQFKIIYNIEISKAYVHHSEVCSV